MQSGIAINLDHELRLITQFAGVYRKRLGGLIDRINHRASPPSDLECIRTCIEAVDMMLSSQARIAQALGHGGAPATRRAA